MNLFHTKLTHAPFYYASFSKNRRLLLVPPDHNFGPVTEHCLCRLNRCQVHPLCRSSSRTANDRNIESIDISRGLSVFKRQRIPKEVLPRGDNLVVEGIGWRRKDFLARLDGDHLDTWNKNDQE